MLAGKPSPNFGKGRASDKVASFVGISDEILIKAEAKERQGTRTDLGNQLSAATKS